MAGTTIVGVSVRARERVTERTAQRLGIAAWAACVILSVAGVIVVWPYRDIAFLDVNQQWASAFLSITYGSVGGFLASRLGKHAVPWIFLTIGLSQSLSAFALWGQALVIERHSWLVPN